MTKRKTTTKTSQHATKQLSESEEAKTSTTVATKPKQANTTAKEASTGGRRGLPKKIKDTTSTFVYEEFPAQTLKQNLVANVLYDQPIVVSELPELKPSKYDRFVGWLTYKLYYYTSYFRGY